MEGSWRGVVWVATVLATGAAMLAASGCGDESGAAGPKGIQTANPERTFAPLIELAADEPWRPMSARWFIERSKFGFAEDDGCPDRLIAVGRTMPELQNPEIDWIYTKGLGGWSWPAYFRNPFVAKCKLDFDRRFYADQLTRPHDPGSRIDGIRPGQGFYLDLVDDARSGPAAGGVGIPVYVQRTDEGDSRVRLTYWTLFGMHGRPGERASHEGDWERVDVLLDADGDHYEPQAVQVSGYVNETAWSATRKVERTHPAVVAALATHTMTATQGRGGCARCTMLETWKSLADARKELWFGFGGAWGQPGPTDTSTGPLGPHDFWPSAADKQREIEQGLDDL